MLSYLGYHFGKMTLPSPSSSGWNFNQEWMPGLNPTTECLRCPDLLDPAVSQSPGGVHVAELGARAGGFLEDPGIPVMLQVTQSKPGFPHVARVPRPSCSPPPSMLLSSLLDFAPVVAVLMPAPAMAPGSMPSLADSISTAFYSILTVSCKQAILSSSRSCRRPSSPPNVRSSL